MRAVCRGPGGGAGRPRRRLLRARRRQHHVDPAGEPGAQGWAVITSRAVFQRQTPGVARVAGVVEETAPRTSPGGIGGQRIEPRRRSAGDPRPADAAPSFPLVALSRPRSIGWSASTRGSRTSCRSRRCRRVCFSMRFMMRRRPISTRCRLVLELQGPLDTVALQAAVQALIGRHASLRAVFQHEGLNRPVASDRAESRAALAHHRSVVAGRRGPRAAPGRHPGRGSCRALRSLPLRRSFARC